MVVVLGVFWLPAGAFKVTMPAWVSVCLKQIIVDWHKKQNRLTKAPETSKTFPLWSSAFIKRKQSPETSLILNM